MDSNEDLILTEQKIDQSYRIRLISVDESHFEWASLLLPPSSWSNNPLQQLPVAIRQIYDGAFSQSVNRAWLYALHGDQTFDHKILIRFSNFWREQILLKVIYIRGWTLYSVIIRNGWLYQCFLKWLLTHRGSKAFIHVCVNVCVCPQHNSKKNYSKVFKLHIGND